MRTIINTLFAFAAIALITSCNGKKSPNYQYFPNMYESVGYEAYSSHKIFEDNNTSEALKPVAGTVNRGWLPYDYENSPAGYSAAKVGLTNPLRYTASNAEKGKALYDIYCAICHGAQGNGKGTLVKREKILGVPSYDDPGRNITAGSIYHVMYYGINSMGSYASQTSTEERWQIAQYVESLKAKLEGKPVRIEAELPKVAHNSHSAMDVSHGEESTEHQALSIDAHVEHIEEHDLHTEVEGHVEKVKEKVSYSKKDLLSGKSHHSHKATGKK